MTQRKLVMQPYHYIGSVHFFNFYVYFYFRSIANHPNRKSLPNIHAASFNFMTDYNKASSADNPGIFYCLVQYCIQLF